MRHAASHCRENKMVRIPYRAGRFRWCRWGSTPATTYTSCKESGSIFKIRLGILSKTTSVKCGVLLRLFC
jgi:hypothetical protein